MKKAFAEKAWLLHAIWKRVASKYSINQAHGLREKILEKLL